MLKIASFATITLFACSATAQDEPRTTTTRTTERRQDDTARKAPINDALAVAAIFGGGAAEIAAARLAEDRAESDDVKKYAAKMIADHTKANRELAELAASRQMTLPTTLEISAQACLDALAGERGKEFDKCYSCEQVTSHMKAVGMVKTVSMRAQDPEVKAWAAKTLPVLEMHLEHAKMLREKHAPEEDAKAKAPAKADGHDHERDANRETTETKPARRNDP